VATSTLKRYNFYLFLNLDIVWHFQDNADYITSFWMNLYKSKSLSPNGAMKKVMSMHCIKSCCHHNFVYKYVYTKACFCVCMFAYIHVCMPYMKCWPTLKPDFTHIENVCIICVYICMFVCMYVPMYCCTNLYMYVFNRRCKFCPIKIVTSGLGLFLELLCASVCSAFCSTFFWVTVLSINGIFTLSMYSLHFYNKFL
jgi:hypothetical protein